MIRFVFFIIVIFLLIRCSCDCNHEKHYKINAGISKLPRIECKDINGDEEVISSNEGEIIVLNFWAIHCVPCILEIPGFNKLVEKYRNNKKIRFIAISLDSIEKVNFFLKKNKYDFEQKFSTEMSKKILKGAAIPRTLIINQQGIVVYDIIGGHSEMYKYIDKIIDTLLNGGILYYENK